MFNLVPFRSSKRKKELLDDYFDSNWPGSIFNELMDLNSYCLLSIGSSYKLL